MISLKIGGIIVAAFIAGAFVASPELRAYAANTVYSTDIVDGQVKTPDIATSAVTNSKIVTGAVTNSKIGTNAVTSSKIADGAIGYADVSRNLIAVEHRSDCNCGGTGWDPDGTSSVVLLYDSRITPNSTVAITVVDSILNCWTYADSIASGFVVVRCSSTIPNFTGINYAIFNNPAYG